MRGVSIVEEREVGRRMPGAVPGGGPLEGETLSGLPIGLAMVSGRRPLLQCVFLLECLAGSMCCFLLGWPWPRRDTLTV